MAERPDLGNSTPPVFFLDDAAAVSRLTPGDAMELTGAEGKHAQVQRLTPGEPVTLTDGRGLRISGQVAGQIPTGLAITILDIGQEPAPEVVITLVQALAKSDRDELAISTAVEVGVDAIVPWQADRSIVIWRPDKAEKARQRWVSAIRAATKQARRTWLPPVQHLVNSKQLANQIETTVNHGGAAWVLDAQGTDTAATAALPTNSEGSGQQNEATADPLDLKSPELLIIVGPEGGIAPTELHAFTEAGAQLVRLGPHIMRTSTAGPVAVARAAERLGRWG